ncbi:hypothetical protein [Kitasatospora sp. KL5]|uniref:hypothetical protein n=1 Tax=Kitasatospora sp. KL5 TaxID=3425125 RepID=UPI003D6DC9F4
MADREQLHTHLEAAWRTMRDNLPVVIALFESTMADAPHSGRARQRLTQDTDMLRDHLEYMRDRGNPLPGDPTLVAAAMGGMLSMLAYALLTSESAGRPDEEVVDTLTDLLLNGLTGPGRPDRDGTGAG